MTFPTENIKTLFTSAKTFIPLVIHPLLLNFKVVVGMVKYALKIDKNVSKYKLKFLLISACFCTLS